MYEILKEEKISGYKVTFRRSVKSGACELVIRHLEGGKHFSIHSKVQLVDAKGKLLRMAPIDSSNIDQVFANLRTFGTTEGLYIRESEPRVESSKFVHPGPSRITPEEVKHKKTLQESTFTATGEKLNRHWPIFKKYHDTGFGSIIRATMTNHQVCSSHCQYCSTIARNKKDSITLDEAKTFVSKLYFDQAKFNQSNFPEHNALYRDLTNSDIRLRGLILSGGGQPNLWPHFEEFVQWLSDKEISLGLITNGFPKDVDESIYEKFEWVRISVTPANASPFYPNQQFDLQYVPKTLVDNPDVTLGLSYVYGPWTDDEIFSRLESAAHEWGANYVRLLTDCNLSRELQLQSHQALGDKLFSLRLIRENGTPTGKIFHQLKYHGTKEEADSLWDEGQCFLQVFNVFWDTTGHEEFGSSYCYPCDSVTVLAESENLNVGNTQVLSERKFNSEKWGTVKNTEVERLFKEKVHPFFDPREQCRACLFMANNKTAKSLSRLDDFSAIQINTELEHVNFP